jgi:hypothetical protein
MRSLIMNSIAVLTLCAPIQVNAQSTDPVKSVKEANDKKVDQKIVDEDVADFLVTSADARMMDNMEGKLAVNGKKESILARWDK